MDEAVAAKRSICEMCVQQVEEAYEEFVRVLLFVTRQASTHCPHGLEEDGGGECALRSGIHLLVKVIQDARHTVRLQGAIRTVMRAVQKVAHEVGVVQ